jgi:hypothetical protein
MASARDRSLTGVAVFTVSGEARLAGLVVRFLGGYLVTESRR